MEISNSKGILLLLEALFVGAAYLCVILLCLVGVALLRNDLACRGERVFLLGPAKSAIMDHKAAP